MEKDKQAKEQRFLEKPCEFNTVVYKIYDYCFKCKDDEGDHCSCRHLLNKEKKIVSARVRNICYFADDDWWLEAAIIDGYDTIRCYKDEFKKEWFFDLSEAVKVLRELNKNSKKN